MLKVLHMTEICGGEQIRVANLFEDGNGRKPLWFLSSEYEIRRLASDLLGLGNPLTEQQIAKIKEMVANPKVS